MSEEYHIPVMLAEVIQMMVTDRSGAYVDATPGGGGHASAVLELVRPAGGRVYGFDADPGAIANARERFAAELDSSFFLRQAYFTQACQWLRSEGIAISGVLLDLGVSSRQLDSDQIGLSYRQEMPLDMRFDPAGPAESAREVVNSLSAEDLATLLRTYGEEPAAWKIAQAIVRERTGRPIRTTTDLRDVIERIIPVPFRVKTLSRVFQALRIYVNDELGELEAALEQFVDLLLPGGRFAVLTYHSLEDRIVKEAFRQEEKGCVCPPDFPVCRCQKVRRLRVLTRKPMAPSEGEIERNPRARSAKLRVAERVQEHERS